MVTVIPSFSLGVRDGTAVPEQATGGRIVGSNPDRSPSSETGRAVVNVRLNGPGRRTHRIEVSPARPALPKLLRTSPEAVDPQGQCE